MTSNKTEKEINIKNNMDKKIIYSNCEPCTPIIIKRYTNHKNILFNSVNNFNFNNFSLSNSFNPNFNFQKNKNEEKKDVNECSLEEIENDFNLLKAKSQNFENKNELIELLLSPNVRSLSENEKLYERPKNPFFKNFKEE
jgi:hypothetical protein